MVRTEAPRRSVMSMPKGNMRRTLSLVGAGAFAAGYILSVIAGLWFPENAGVIATLVILGLVVGAVNVTGREIVPYLVAAIALILIGNSGAFLSLNIVFEGLGERINGIVRLMSTFTAPAAVIQAIRAGMMLAAPGDSKKDDK